MRASKGGKKDRFPASMLIVATLFRAVLGLVWLDPTPTPETARAERNMTMSNGPAITNSTKAMGPPAIANPTSRPMTVSTRIGGWLCFTTASSSVGNGTL